MNVIKTSKVQDGVSLPEFTSYTIYLSSEEFRLLYTPLIELLFCCSSYDDECARLQFLSRCHIPKRSKWLVVELLKAL